MHEDDDVCLKNKLHTRTILSTYKDCCRSSEKIEVGSAFIVYCASRRVAICNQIVQYFAILCESSGLTFDNLESAVSGVAYLPNNCNWFLVPTSIFILN
jgi:hypothetical protein